MLIESSVHLPAGFAMLQDILHGPTGDQLPRILLRWAHFVAGITWIGLLYFFNLVNVPFQKGIDADTKKKVNPDLLTRSLWYFRWGALVTVLVGLMYYAMYILPTDVTNANNIGGAKANIWLILLVWLIMAIITFAIEFLIITRVPALTKDGRILAVVIAILVFLMAYGIICWLNYSLTGTGGAGDSYVSNKTFSIGIGGALGLIMLLNVWGIIWPSQKRIIAATAGTGPAAPPELARRAFLASRANAWLSLPMLFFMATSHGDYIILGK
ncbi:MAG TPA: urate hydroxylase PuuD [Pyrinomonadaceae bacterium]|nr:urate hydroxylase PuuD [Pyrinomonadaceae bacterium]